jgi:adenosine deaminase
VSLITSASASSAPAFISRVKPFVAAGRPVSVASGPNDSCCLSQRDTLCMSRQQFEAQLKAMPKVQYHGHLEGWVRPETILEEADRLGRPRPAESVEQMKELVSMRPGENLLDFLKKFDPFRFVFEDRQSIERISYEAVEDNVKDGVGYVELRMNCQKNLNKISIGEVMDAALDGMHRAAQELGVEANFIASINRSYAAEDAMAIVKEAVQRKGRGVIGIDLAGDEINHPPVKFKEVFDYARQNGLHVTVHAGEAMGPDSIAQAIDELGATRIGHGTRLREDQQLFDRVVAQGIHLEMNPTSNLLLNVVDSLKGYPLREYFEAGISTSINTDDQHIFQVGLVDEYMEQARLNNFSLQELQQMNLRALDHAFLPAERRQELKEEFAARYEQFNQQIVDSWNVV